jgi:hypothetical protein
VGLGSGGLYKMSQLHWNMILYLRRSTKRMPFSVHGQPNGEALLLKVGVSYSLVHLTIGLG